MNPPEVWLIDGWNLLHGLQGRERPQSKSLNAEHLLALTADLASLTGFRAIVVWDGHGALTEKSSKKSDSFPVQVIYSERQTADSVIERYLFENRAKVRCSVVSDDSAVAMMARGSGARVISSKMFSELLAEAGRERKNADHDARVREHGFNRPFDRAFKKREQ